MEHLKFGSGEKCFSNESVSYMSNTNINSFDYLIFLDSRGLVINEDNFEESYAYRLMAFLDDLNSSYVCISRPKNLTVFATLYNFLVLNPSFSFENLITNLGFVDCTPKKESIIEDIEEQINDNILMKLNIEEQQNYLLNTGKYEVLKTISYNNKYIEKISKVLNEKFNKLYFINTPEINDDTSIGRKRPNSFFVQLKITNELLESIIRRIEKSVKIIDISKLNSTYDAVHYDKIGHQKVFNKIRESIKECIL